MPSVFGKSENKQTAAYGYEEEVVYCGRCDLYSLVLEHSRFGVEIVINPRRGVDYSEYYALDVEENVKRYDNP